MCLSSRGAVRLLQATLVCLVLFTSVDRKDLSSFGYQRSSISFLEPTTTDLPTIQPRAVNNTTKRGRGSDEEQSNISKDIRPLRGRKNPTTAPVSSEKKSNAVSSSKATTTVASVVGKPKDAAADKISAVSKAKRRDAGPNKNVIKPPTQAVAMTATASAAEKSAAQKVPAADTTAETVAPVATVESLPANLTMLPPEGFPPVQIIVVVSGELGNHLSYISHSLALQRRAKELYNVRTELVIHPYSLSFRNRRESYFRSRNEMRTCFPGTRSLKAWEDDNYQLDPLRRPRGNKPDEQLEEAQKIQKDILGKRSSDQLILQDGVTNWKRASEHLRNVLEDLHKPGGRYAEGSSKLKNTPFSFPFVTSPVMATYVYQDRFYDVFQETLRFDPDAHPMCCNTRPRPDEHVFHFRNFLAEEPTAIAAGLEELSPNKMATEVFGHLSPGSKIAIASRFADHPNVVEYKRAFEARNWTVRTTQGNTGIQDFCLLQQGRQEVVGLARSSFVSWAGYLSSASKVLLYSVRSPTTQKMHDERKRLITRDYDWERPELKRQIHFSLINTEEMDEKIAANKMTPHNSKKEAQ